MRTINILLLAHDEKRELLVQFCEAQQEVLKEHNLFASEPVAESIERTIGKRINRIINTFSGEYQQVSAYLSCNEIDLMLFFRKTMLTDIEDRDEINMLYMCDRYGIPVATNIATAKLLLYAIKQKNCE